MGKFGLALHPEKTRLMKFGPFAAENRRKRGEGKPATFMFLAFSHLCGRKRWSGGFIVKRTATVRHWLKAFRRRSQHHRMTWERFDQLVDRWIPNAVEPQPKCRGTVLLPHGPNELGMNS